MGEHIEAKSGKGERKGAGNGKELGKILIWESITRGAGGKSGKCERKGAEKGGKYMPIEHIEVKSGNGERNI